MALLVIVAVAAIEFDGSASTRGTSTTRTTASTSIPLSPPFVGDNSTTDSNGIELSLSLNATSLGVGQALLINTSLYNGFPRPNTLSLNNNSWTFQGVPVGYWSPCYVNSYATSAAELVVLRGYYVAQNISNEAMTRFSYAGTCHEFVSLDNVIFQSQSSLANLTGSGLSNHLDQIGPLDLSTSYSASGYFLLGNSTSPVINGATAEDSYLATQPFTPGVYTVGVADEWGQSVILHFVVEANG